MANDEFTTNMYQRSSFDENLLIELVKERPVIWDLTEDNYRKKVQCEKAWEEVLSSLYPGFSRLESERKTSLTKDAKKKWTNLRDCFNKSREAGKESSSKFKTLDFLSKVFDEKEKRGSLFTTPPKEKARSCTTLVDPDADTQINRVLQRFQGGERSNFRENTTQERCDTMNSDLLTEQESLGNLINSPNISMEEGDNSQNNTNYESSVSYDMKPSILPPQPPSSTTCSAYEPEEVVHSHKGVKRSLEEDEEDNGVQHLLQFVRKSLTKNFTESQNKNLRSEIIKLINSVCIGLENTELLELLLSTMKNVSLEQKCETAEKIIRCVANANRV